MKFLSLFSGIGGFDLGLERAGWECVGQVEIDPYCRAVLAKHWPNVWRHDDIRTLARRIADCEPETEDGEVRCLIHDQEFGECPCVGTDQLIDTIGPIDAIVGGDPCQGHSNAARHGQLAKSLGYEYLRVVDQLTPGLVIRENPATVRKDAEWSGRRFADALRTMGYNARTIRLRACCAGADHRRDRMFVFAALPHANGPRLEGYEREVVARANEGRHHADIARPNRWSATPRVCRGADGIPNRMDRIRALGNAVVPQVAEVIGRAINEALREQAA